MRRGMPSQRLTPSPTCCCVHCSAVLGMLQESRGLLSACAPPKAAVLCNTQATAICLVKIWVLEQVVMYTRYCCHMLLCALPCCCWNAARISQCLSIDSPVASMGHEDVGCCSHRSTFRAQHALEKALTAQQRLQLPHNLRLCASLCIHQHNKSVHMHFRSSESCT